jgi:hypothetical protein
MSDLPLHTVDDVSRATVPTTIRKASNLELDAIFNAARSHLRCTDPADIRQTESSLDAVLRECAWRRDRATRGRAWVALIVSILAFLMSLWVAFSPGSP